mgnify:CR=1 FL=1
MEEVQVEVQVEDQVEEDGIGISRTGTEIIVGVSQKGAQVGTKQTMAVERTTTVDGLEETALRGVTRVLRRGCTLSTKARSS